jgi:EAL domain-containing protein (putative c-di-GMP-specific phosphodiesterase class I)
MSVGVLGINGTSGDAASVLKNAALSCCTAKQAGGGRAHLFSDGDAGQAHQRSVMGWAYRIDNAIASNSFWLRAQKIAGIGANSQAKPLYELLLGVRDEQGKQVSPAPLIEAGERFRKSSLIDRWVVETSLHYLNANETLLAQSSGYHINLSAHSLNDDAFLEFLEQRLSHYQLICNKIVFEITETAAVANTHYAADFMLRLKKLGCRFALDDFGTGFSSYNYLQNLPVDYLKIDGTFVTDITSNMVNYAMVKSIAELGRFLGMEVIAECVEDRATIEALKTMGVEWVQGYAIGAPVSLAQSVNENSE